MTFPSLVLIALTYGAAITHTHTNISFIHSLPYQSFTFILMFKLSGQTEQAKESFSLHNLSLIPCKGNCFFYGHVGVRHHRPLAPPEEGGTEQIHDKLLQSISDPFGLSISIQKAR